MTLRRFHVLTAATVAALSFHLALSVRAQETSSNRLAVKDFDLVWGVKIPLRDGVRLNATVYKPKGAKEPLPVVFSLTPYIGDIYHDRAMYFARNGYVYVAVDVRGRGNSEGSFEPWASDGRDGYDIVEWLARQPWSNGKVAMSGGSYNGFTQWATLLHLPPHLVTIAPDAPGHPGYDFPFWNNIFFTGEMRWITYTSGVTPNDRLSGDASFWRSKYRELYLAHRPFSELDRIVGNPSPVFQKWLAHPTPDEYWDSMVLPQEVKDLGAKESSTRNPYFIFTVPVLSITGQYDWPGDAEEYYRQHMKYGNPVGIANHYLIVGPWDHAGTRTPNREVGGLKFGEASLLDLDKLHMQWYDWTMKGGPKPEFLKKRVAYYVVGAEEWKYTDSLETIANAKKTLYLHSDGQASDVFHSGQLREEKPRASSADKYVYDPLDTRPGEIESGENRRNLTSQTRALNLYGNGLVYHSEPFAEATEVSGHLKFVAWIAMDVPDTDFLVDVYEILPDGGSVELTRDLMRARYRESLRQERLVTPGKIERYEFSSFNFFSRRIAKGSRLRLLLACSNSIFLEKNYNSGGAVAAESGRVARTAHITLYHDADHPSFLELPIVR